MFGTEDEYERAVRNSTLHTEEQKRKDGQSILTSLLLFVALSSISYAGYTYYKTKLVGNEVLMTTTKVQVYEKKAEKDVRSMSKEEPIEYEDDYIMALNNMEVDILDETSGEPTAQFNLSQAMSEVVADAMNSADSDYIEGLKKEINAH
jgi:hypothetical protein